MKIQVYGPFQYEEQTPEKTIALFDEIASHSKNLGFGVGLYVFAARDSSGNLKPWYVGKSTRHDLGARIVGHLNNDKFSTLIDECNGISLFLAAVVDEQLELRTRYNLPASEAEEIGILELAFIGSAWSQNRQLLNKQGKNSKPFIATPGLLISGGLAGGSSATQLAELLGFK